MHIFENAQGQFEGRFALIVVGRMGHGKSSFCKMIVNDEEKPIDQVHVSVKKATLDCKIYLSNRFNHIFDDDIFIIDTPGLDYSYNSSSYIAEEINNLIIKYKLSIAGIAWVLDIMQTNSQLFEQCTISTLLNLLRVKYCYKINLTFCVLSKFDKYYEDEEEIEELTKQFSNMFQKNQYSQIWKRNIQWMSRPIKDQSRFYKRITTILKQQFKEQFRQLNDILKYIKGKNYFLHYNQYQKDNCYFESLLKNSIIDDNCGFSIQEKTESTQLTVEIKYEYNLNPLKVLFGDYKKLVGSIKLNMDQKILKQGLKLYLAKIVLGQAQLVERTFTFKSLPFTAYILAFDQSGKMIPVETLSENNKILYKSELLFGKNQIKIFYKTSAFEFYRKFLRENVQEFYNQT